jgi:hypothetical protein
MPVKKVVPPSLLERGQILAANMAANDAEAEELVLALAEKYRPPNLAATSLWARSYCRSPSPRRQALRGQRARAVQHAGV